MNWRLLAAAVTGVAMLGMAVPAEAAKKRVAKKAKAVQSQCLDNYGGPTWRGIWFNGEPQPNGCSPAVFANGRYIGQDPDPFIRSQLLRQPETGYTITK